MTVCVSGGGAPPDAPAGHALDLLHSALDVVELLILHVIEPGRAEPEPRPAAPVRRPSP